MKLNGFQKFEDSKINLSGISGGAAGGVTVSGEKSTVTIGKDTDSNCECPPEEPSVPSFY